MDGEKEWTTAAAIKKKNSAPRSYVIETNSGKSNRNRQLLQFVSQKEQSIEQTLQMADKAQEEEDTMIPDGPQLTFANKGQPDG